MHDMLAHAAVEPISSAMVVGLGTGRAAARAIHALAARAHAEKLDVTCVATSEASARLAESLGLRVRSMDEIERVDYLFDGADEIDGQLRMIKGRGGAMTREKIVARAASRRVYLVQRAKVVMALGHGAPLPIEVLEFGLRSTRAVLARLGLEGTVRAAADSTGHYRTDNGHVVIDASMPRNTELEALRAAIDDLPGVVGHGLFLHEADHAIVEESEGGAIEHLSR